jgi:hypothetical protein
MTKLIVGQIETNGLLTPNSMAAEIETAINAYVPRGANENPLARQKLVIAIAYGVIKHLRNNSAALQVNVPNIAWVGSLQEPVTIDTDIGVLPTP